jgi:hypothetical protein
MRYGEVVRHYLSAREASSREWEISPTLVMCVELDASQDGYLTLAVATCSSQQRRAPHLLRVTLFRVHDDSVHGWDATPVPLPQSGRLDDHENVAVAQHRAVIDEWVRGSREQLPPSTSTKIGDRLHQKR